MADAKLTAKTELTTPANDDWLYIVDKSDTTDDAAGSSKKIKVSSLLKEYREYAVSDELTALTVGTNKLSFRMPFAMTLTEVRASVITAPTGAAIIVDINEGGSSILSTKLSIDATEETSTTAATPAVISDATLADDAKITIDIDQVGSTIAGVGLKIVLIGYRT